MRLVTYQFMIKILFLLLLWGWLPLKSFAQNNIIPTAPYDQLSVEDRLVQLAWNARSEQALIQSEIAIADQEVKVARWAWADNLRTSFNLNEFTIQGTPDAGDRPLFFPRYNFNIGLALGDAISNPAQIKIAKQRRLAAESQRSNTQLDLRAEVLEAYQNYRLAISLYQISTEQNEEGYTNFLMVSEKFKTGEVILSEYNEAQRLYNTTRAAIGATGDSGRDRPNSTGTIHRGFAGPGASSRKLNQRLFSEAHCSTYPRIVLASFRSAHISTTVFDCTIWLFFLCYPGAFTQHSRFWRLGALYFVYCRSRTSARGIYQESTNKKVSFY